MRNEQLRAALEGPHVQVRHENFDWNDGDKPVRTVQHDRDGGGDDGDPFRLDRFGAGGRRRESGFAGMGLARGFDQRRGVAQGLLNIPGALRLPEQRQNAMNQGPAPCPDWIRRGSGLPMFRRAEMSGGGTWFGSLLFQVRAELSRVSWAAGFRVCSGRCARPAKPPPASPRARGHR